jgi:hypothetical protein
VLALPQVVLLVLHLVLALLEEQLVLHLLEFH